MNIQSPAAHSGLTQRMFDMTLDVIDALVCICAPDGTIYRFNRKCEEISGYSAAEMLGASVWDLVPPEERDEVIDVVSKNYSDDFPVRHVNQWMTRAGGRALIAWNNDVIVDGDGRVEFIIGTGIDISDKKRLESSFRAAIDSFEDGFALFDGEDRLVAVNGSFWRFYESVRDHIAMGMSFREVSEAVHAHTSLKYLYPDFETYWAVRTELNQNFVREYAPGRFTRARTFSTGDGGRAVIVTDITDEMLHDQTLRSLIKASSDQALTHKERLEKMLLIGRKHFGMEVGILTRVAGNASTIEFVSTDDEVFKIGGTVSLRDSYSRYFLDEQSVLAIEDIQETNLPKEPPYERKPLASMIGVPVNVSGLRYGALYFASAKVTARKFSDDDKQLVQLFGNWAGMKIRLDNVMSELDKFAYVASHDLKAPLRAIDNLAQWIEEDAGDVLDGEVRGYLTLLRGRTARLERLLNDLLAFSRAGRTAGTPVPVDTAKTVREAVELLAPPAHLHVEVANDLPTVAGDPVSLTQIFSNLISNAIKHHDKDSGKIEISVADFEDYWEFSIEDDGPGIPTEFRDRVFDIFQTLRPRDEVEGSGMGLAIVKKLIEAGGGTIAVDEREGAETGAVFRFTWPKSTIKA